jgi:ribonuclease-3
VNSRRERRKEELPGDALALSKRLGYRFRDPELLLEALTHASTGGKRSYERLEFLGDRVLGLVVADMLFRAFPKEPEGFLARRHAALVRQDSLALIAERLDLAPHLRLSAGEEEGGGRSNPAILADVCEAILGAVYLDGGLGAARSMIEPLWQPLLAADRRPPQDSKTALQEWAQGCGRPLPSYTETARAGSAHEPIFTVRVQVEGEEPAEGQGRSKRAAEQAAAGALLDRIKAEGKAE